MNKKNLNRIFLLSVAGVLIVLLVIGIVRINRQLSETPILMEETEHTLPDVVTIQLTPKPTEVPALPEEAVTLLVDKVPALTLSSEGAAQRLLWNYLTDSAAAPEGETFVSARFDCELIITPAEAGSVVAAENDALVLLMNLPETVPVRMETVRTDYASDETAVNATDNAYLDKGSRIISQIGSGGLQKSVVARTYVAGKLVEEGEPTVTTVRSPRATIVENGTYDKKDKDGEPDKKQGEKWKAPGDMTLALPMSGTVSSNFGYRNGEMHNGVDILGKAGGEVTSPGEGVVRYCGERGSYGFTVDIDHGNGFVSRLTHLENVSVELHQRVFAGDAIGTLAEWDAGEAKLHLHYELIGDNVPVNPLFYCS